MRKFILFCLLAAMSLPAAAVDGNEVAYSDGTVSAMSKGAIGKLDTSPGASLQFESAGTKLFIPYASIESIEYSKEVSHHLGVLPAIAVGLVKRRQRRHYFRISYHDDNNSPQVAIFEVPKTMPRTLLAVLNARAPQAKWPKACHCNN